MTSFTTPRTWSDGTTPTASQLNVDIRDNMNHMYETVDHFGFPYAPCDPRVSVTSTSFSANNTPYYVRANGRGAVSSIRVAVKTSTGSISLGAYEGSGRGVADRPTTKIGASNLVTCPAVGVADVALVESCSMEPGDWFAYVADAASFLYGGSGVIGWDSSWVGTFFFEAVDKTELPTTPDVTVTYTSGAYAGPAFVGVA